MSTNYCDTCQKSDCACICSVCLNHQPQRNACYKNQENKQEKKKIRSVAIPASSGHTPNAQVSHTNNSR